MRQETAVLGDVHGDVHRLQRALEDLAEASQTIVLVGDYVDRGENSRDVIDLLLQKKRELGERLVTLRGNHEAALLEFLEVGHVANYVAHGGIRTIQSYGFRTVRSFFHGFPKEHRDFLQTTLMSYSTPDLLVSHGGFDTEDPFNFDSPRCVYGDSRIFGYDGRWPRPLTVFGHFVQDGEPYRTQHLICLDTGCGTLNDGPLSAVLLPDVVIRQY